MSHPYTRLFISSTAGPTIDEDSDAGFEVGDVWIYSGQSFQAVDVTPGAAVWEEITGGGGSYTDEEAQDAIGAMVDTTLEYVDATPLLRRAALTGDVTAPAGSNSTTVTNASVIAKVLTAFSAGAGVVSSTDSILTAFQKVIGNIALKLTANSPITGATKTKITYDANGLVTAGADIGASDLPSGIDAAKISAGSVSNTEFDYLNGVTSAIQAQIDLKASITYVDALIGANDAMVYKGVIDCSANPNYPAADAGHLYKVSVAGKIGGASGPNVEAGDSILCIADSTASGNHATVGASWDIIQVNIDGAVIGPASAVTARIATFNGTSGKLIQDGGATIASLGTGVQINAASSESTIDGGDSVGFWDASVSLLKQILWSDFLSNLASALSGVFAEFAEFSTHTHNATDTVKLSQANTHQSPDTDTGTSSLHHTIGTGASQAAAGTRGVTNGDAHDHVGGDGAAINNCELQASCAAFNPADATTYHFGAFPTLTPGPAANRKLYIPRAGTIKRIDLVFVNTTTDGSNEQSTVSLRLNNTTDTTITATLALNATPVTVTNSSLSIAVAAGDWIAIKWVTPTWVTNPVGTIISAQVWIE